MTPSEKQVRNLLDDMGATFRKDQIEKIITIRVGPIKQSFWLGSWPTIGEWLEKQKPVKQKKKRA